MSNEVQKIDKSFLKKQYIEKAIYDISISNEFYSGLLQEINIGYVNYLPTAAIMYDKKKDEFNVGINFEFFHSLTAEERSAVFFHEILHFTHQHIFRAEKFFASPNKEDKKLFNIAADMAINQYINNLPKDAINVANFKLKDGKPFPKHRPFEEYMNLLKDTASKPYGGKDGENKGDGTNDEQLGKYFQDGDKCNGQHGSGSEGDPCPDCNGNNGPIDSHLWEELSEDEKQRMLKEAAKVIKRTIEKTSNNYSLCPGGIKDLLEEIESKISAINYKKILQETIKKTLCLADRQHTWKRPSKRFGNLAPGTRTGNLPKLNMYIDTSGSISYTEMSEFLQVMDGFLKVGAKTCTLGLWHTELYKVQKYKKAQEFQQDWIESGGTDVSGVMAHIDKVKPDLAIILTDTYFEIPKFKPKSTEVIFISSIKEFNKELLTIGKVIPLHGILEKHG